jgi:hypothetical protein
VPAAQRQTRYAKRWSMGRNPIVSAFIDVLAERHNLPGVASSATAILIGRIILLVEQL